MLFLLADLSLVSKYASVLGIFFLSKRLYASRNWQFYSFYCFSFLTCLNSTFFNIKFTSYILAIDFYCLHLGFQFLFHLYNLYIINEHKVVLIGQVGGVGFFVLLLKEILFLFRFILPNPGLLVCNFVGLSLDVSLQLFFFPFLFSSFFCFSLWLYINIFVAAINLSLAFLMYSSSIDV